MSSEFYWLSIHFSVCGVGFPLHPQRCQALVTKEPTQIKKCIFVNGFYVSKDVVMHGKYLANINYVMKSPYENVLSKVPKT